jgi:hypothetical protein
MLRAMFVSILTVALFGSAAHACLNDRETDSREIEFKSQYEPSVSPETPVADGPNYLDIALYGAGSALGMAGLGMGIGVGVMAARRPR